MIVGGLEIVAVLTLLPLVVAPTKMDEPKKRTSKIIRSGGVLDAAAILSLEVVRIGNDGIVAPRTEVVTFNTIPASCKRGATA